MSRVLAAATTPALRGSSSGRGDILSDHNVRDELGDLRRFRKKRDILQHAMSAQGVLAQDRKHLRMQGARIMKNRIRSCDFFRYHAEMHHAQSSQRDLRIIPWRAQSQSKRRRLACNDLRLLNPVNLA